MNCEKCQRLLLAAEDVSALPQEAALHLGGCAACRRVLETLIKIESNLPRVPVPPSTRKHSAIQFFLNPAPAASMPAPRPLLPRFKRWALAGAAAALVIGAGIGIGIWVARIARPVDQVVEKKSKPMEPPTEDEKAPEEKKVEVALAELVLECDMELAETSDPGLRVEALAKLARGLRDESDWLAPLKAGKELKTIARLHGKVLAEGLVPRARTVPMDDRRRTLGPIVTALSESHVRLKTLAPRATPEASRPLEEMTEATAEAVSALREILGEATE